MRSILVRLTFFLCSVLAGGLILRAGAHAEFDVQSSSDLPVATTFGKPIGSQTCAAAGCHGSPNATNLTGPPSRDCWQSSFTHVFLMDPHRQAFDVLSSDKSKKITAALRKTNPSVPDAVNDTRCLACHTNPSLAIDSISVESKKLRSDGVSCEACHGNAEKWLSSHTAWRTDDLRNKAENSTNFKNLNNLDYRARVCAGCHIGDAGEDGRPARDMNHDMIAAGHPRLTFDFVAHHERLPKHWREKDRTHAGYTDRPADFISSNWELGERAKTLATVRLVHDRALRAERKDERTPWPELSESSCTSCHRTLNPGKPPFDIQRKPGELAWNVSPVFREECRELIEAISKNESLAAIRNAAQRAAVQLEGAKPKGKVKDSSTQEGVATQYAELRALELTRRAHGGKENPEIDTAFEKLEKGLKDPNRFPAMTIPEYEDALKRLSQLLGRVEK